MHVLYWSLQDLVSYSFVDSIRDCIESSQGDVILTNCNAGSYSINILITLATFSMTFLWKSGLVWSGLVWSLSILIIVAFTPIATESKYILMYMYARDAHGSRSAVQVMVTLPLGCLFIPLGNHNYGWWIAVRLHNSSVSSFSVWSPAGHWQVTRRLWSKTGDAWKQPGNKALQLP